MIRVRWRAVSAVLRSICARAIASGSRGRPFVADDRLAGGTVTPSPSPTPSYSRATPIRTVGPVGTASPISPRSVTPTPHRTVQQAGNTVVVTEANSGSTVRLHPGQYLEVRLAPDGGSWHPPVSNDDAILRRVSAAGGYPDGTTAFARFVARRTGRTSVTSTTDFGCLHTSPPCRPPQRGFDITVVVR